MPKLGSGKNYPPKLSTEPQFFLESARFFLLPNVEVSKNITSTHFLFPNVKVSATPSDYFEATQNTRESHPDSISGQGHDLRERADADA